MDRRFARFVFSGAVATITTYTVLIVGVELLDLSAILASVVGYALGILVNYLLNYRFTFRAKEHHAAVLPKFLLVMFTGMFANAAIMSAGIEWLGLHYLVSQLVAIAVVLSWSYTANRLWTFAN